MKRILLSAAIAIGFLAPAAPVQAQESPFVGQMINVGLNFCPRAWGEANGQLLAISSNEALFSLIGNIYGGDGRTTFALPDLRGRTIVDSGTGAGLQTFRIGERGGVNRATLTRANLAPHGHVGTSKLHANSTAAAGSSTSGAALASSKLYTGARGGTVDVEMLAGAATTTVTATGGNQSISIEDPFLGTRWCIALFGTYPSRN